MGKKTKRNLSKGAVLAADLKSHSIMATLSACGKSGTEDKQENSFDPKVSEQDMSKVVVGGPTNNQD